MPLLTRIGPGEVVPLKRVSPQDVGSGAANSAYGDAAGTFALIAARVEASEQTANIARSVAGGSAALEAIVSEESQNPDHNGRAERFEKGRSRIVGEFRKQVKGGQFQADYDTRMFSIGERARFSVQEGVLRRRQDVARGDLTTGVDALVTQASRAESSAISEGLLEQAGSLLDQGVADGSITATERAQLKIRHDKVLDDAARARNSIELATEIMGASSDPMERLAIARKRIGTGDAQLLDVTIARLKDMSAEERYAKQEAEKAQADALVGDFYDGKLKRADLIGRDLPASLRATLEAGFDRRDAAATGEVTTNREVYNKAQDLMLDPERRAEAAAFDVTTLTPHLSKTDQDKIREMQRAPDPGLEAINAEIARYTGTFILGGKKSPTDEAQAESVLEFRRQAEDALERKRRALGRKHLADDEVEQVLDQQVQRYWKDTWAPLDADKKRIFEVRVPAADRERLRAALVNGGVPAPTEEVIRDAWLDEQGYAPEERE